MSNSIRQILVGTDFSEPSINAVLHADALAQLCQANLTALFAQVLHDDLSAGVLDAQWDQFRDRVGERFAALKSEYQVDFESRVERDVSARNALLRTAESVSADLIIVGTHGRTGMGRLALGSVAEGVVRDAPVSVLSVHYTTPHAPYRRILVPVDLSDRSGATLRYAASLAEDFGAELAVVHVVEPLTVPPYFPLDYCAPAPDEVRGAVVEFVRKQLPDQDVPVHVLSSRVAEGVCRLAEDQDFDLIVTGTRGLHGLMRLALGSVAEKILRLSGVPVWIYKPAG